MDLFPARSGGVVAPSRVLRQTAKRTSAMRAGNKKAQQKANVARDYSTYLDHLFGGWAEISQIGRRLAALRGQQEPLGAEEIRLPADLDMAVALGADPLPPSCSRPLHANVALLHRPGVRQRIVDGRDLVVQQIGLGLVEIDPLLDDRRIVGMQWQPARII